MLFSTRFFSIILSLTLSFSFFPMAFFVDRRQAQSLDLKFHSTGITRQRDGALVKVDPRKGERGIFDALKIEWREPWERCADI